MDNINNVDSIMFSVIVPVYNAEKYINKCILSVLNQTYRNFEIIAIDDESKDNSYSRLLKLAKNDKRIRVFTQKNIGPGLTRNKGIELACGKYIVFIDSDDYIEPDYLALIKTRIDACNPDVIYIDVVQEDENGNILCEERLSNHIELQKHDFICSQMTGKIPWGGVRKVVKKTFICDRNIKYSNDIVGEEAIYSFEVLRNAKKYAFVDKVVYHYVNHPGSQSKNNVNTSQSFTTNGWTIIAKKMHEYLIENNCIDEYKTAINGFGFTALVGWLLVNSNKPLFLLRKQFIHMIKAFEVTYGWEINSDYLRKETKVILPFIKFRIIVPLIVFAKLKARRRRI